MLKPTTPHHPAPPQPNPNIVGLWKFSNIVGAKYVHPAPFGAGEKNFYPAPTQPMNTPNQSAIYIYTFLIMAK